jgi:uncharacterized OB-fold protein
MSAAPGRAPMPDLESEPFWEGLAAQRVVLQVCGACGRHRFPRMPSCPYCGVPGGTDVVVPGTGHVYSWIRVHRDLAGAGDPDDGDLPYAIVTVTLDTGPRLVGRLEPADRAAVDLPVRPLFVDHPGWTELRFQPDDKPDRPPRPEATAEAGADPLATAEAGDRSPDHRPEPPAGRAGEVPA